MAVIKPCPFSTPLSLCNFEMLIGRSLIAPTTTLNLSVMGLGGNVAMTVPRLYYFICSNTEAKDMLKKRPATAFHLQTQRDATKKSFENEK